MKAPKRRIRQSAWGNWYGYEGSRKVIEFSNTPFEAQEDMAIRWASETGSFEVIQPKYQVSK